MLFQLIARITDQSLHIYSDQLPQDNMPNLRNLPVVDWIKYSLYVFDVSFVFASFSCDWKVDKCTQMMWKIIVFHFILKLMPCLRKAHLRKITFIYSSITHSWAKVDKTSLNNRHKVSRRNFFSKILKVYG